MDDESDKFEGFFSNGDNVPIGTVYGPFDTHGDAMNTMLDIAYCTDSSTKRYFRTMMRHSGEWIVDYGSYSKFIVIRKISKNNG